MTSKRLQDGAGLSPNSRDSTTAENVRLSRPAEGSAEEFPLEHERDAGLAASDRPLSTQSSRDWGAPVGPRQRSIQEWEQAATGGWTPGDRRFLTIALLLASVLIGGRLFWDWQRQQLEISLVSGASPLVSPLRKAPRPNDMPTRSLAEPAVGLLSAESTRSTLSAAESTSLDRRTSPVLYQIDINSAGWVEWAQLDGIGEILARRIVADRDERGQFLSVDDVQRVRGIGRKTLERMRPHLRIQDLRIQDSRIEEPRILEPARLD